MLRKYRYTGEAEALIPDLHRIVQPGEVIETDLELNHPDLKLEKTDRKRGAEE